MKIFSPCSLFLAALALSACEDAAAPEGQPGDLTVAAYIDNDASGSLTAGDTPLANFEIAVLHDGQEVASGTTAGDGRVTFADLAPGSYVIEPGGPVPPGATLTSNPSPSAVIDFRGRSVSVDFRYAMFPGVVEGRVFRDENANGTFEQGTDVPGPGLWVFLRADTGAVGAKLDSVRTDSLGAYRFGRVAPGNYYLEFERLGAINYGTAGATRQITVVGAASTSLNVLYTGSIFVTVRQARATPVDTTVAVIGDITVPPGVFNGSTPGANSEIWVQDTTGGIAAFPVPTADSAVLRLGTRIEVVGPITLFSGQKQIGRTGTAPTIRVRTGGAQVAAKPNTAAEARTLADEGRLVTVSGLRIDSVPGGTGGAFNVRTVSATNDTLTIRVNGTATGLTRASFVVGERYNITGILTQFNGTAQLKPRFATDVAQIVAMPVARIILNELMANPNAVSDAAGEYIELHNWGTADANIQNWTIEDAAVNKDTINISLVVPAGGYVLLALNGNAAQNGGLTVDFVFERISLNNTGTPADRIILRDASGATIDSVAYAATQAVAGTAVGVRDPSAENADATGANWQAQTSTYGTAAVPDRGTPRAQNDGYITPTQPTPLVGRADGTSPLNKKQR
ncbi:MAG TPA: lamin tail domain-containing protein [Gemmatimonadaceae bacterium]|nr:lamin tail domain-containing protein [Gemmatimonadaceae bacterium]